MQYLWLSGLWTCPSSSVLKRIGVRKLHLVWVKVKAKAYGGTWLPSFLTPLDGGERSTGCLVALLPLKATPVFIEEEGGCVELVWTRRRKDIFFVLAGNRAQFPWLYSS